MVKKRVDGAEGNTIMPRLKLKNSDYNKLTSDLVFFCWHLTIFHRLDIIIEYHRIHRLWDVFPAMHCGSRRPEPSDKNPAGLSHIEMVDKWFDDYVRRDIPCAITRVGDLQTLCKCERLGKQVWK